jgi:hypothetical protein
MKFKVMNKEADVKENVKRVLDDTSAWWFMPPANGFGRSGVPDFVGCVNGYMFAVETKFGKGTTTANQGREIQTLIQNGARVWIVRETNIDDWHMEFKAWAALCS